MRGRRAEQVRQEGYLIFFLVNVSIWIGTTLEGHYSKLYKPL